MERSLSVLLPVRDAESTLGAMVLEILEILPELTPRFELVIIDDGSCDATVEVADELAARYPQVSVAVHTKPLGRAVAIRTGLDHSSGEVIFLRDEDCTLVLDEVHKLWEAVRQHEMVFGRSDPCGRLSAIGWRRRKREGGFRMIHRRAIQKAEPSLCVPLTPSDAPRQAACRWHEVDIQQRAVRQHVRRDTSRAGRASPAGSPPPKTTPRRPNYLTRLRDFALGE